MLQKLLMISCLLVSPLYGVRVIESDCEAPEGRGNGSHNYPGYPANDSCGAPPIFELPTYPLDYPAYPGIAYERSFTTAQLVTAVLVSTAFFVIVGVALTNTPKNHGKNCHSCHH